VPSFLVLTLGCKLNQLESEAISDTFFLAGFTESGAGNQETKSGEQNTGNYPAIIVINTCTVTSKADQKARRVIRKALRDYPESYVIVTGCYAQLNKADLQKLGTGCGNRLFIVKKDEIINLPQYIRGGSARLSDKLNAFNISLSQRETNKHKRLLQNFQTEGLRFKRASIDNRSFTGLLPEKLLSRGKTNRILQAAQNLFVFNPSRFSQHTRSFLKIQDGCDKHCTYCRIRLARGPSISLAKEEVLSRLRILEESHAEAVLTGVNICQYKDCGSGIGLAGLLKYLLEGTKKIAVRLSSLAPDCVDENIAEVLSNRRIRPHFHLSVQSGSNETLKRMGRSYSGEIVEKAVNLLRNAKDDPFIACDIITGFPGEAINDFEQTVSLCQKLDFAWCHVFPYSKRSGTPAFSFSGAVAETESSRRAQLLINSAKLGKADYVQRWIGREIDVLIEESKHLEHKLSPDNDQFHEFSGIMVHGTSENYLKILVKCKGERISLPGTVVRCKIVGNMNSCYFDAYADFL